jgi:uncharacterized membrane protein YgcG
LDPSGLIDVPVDSSNVKNVEAHATEQLNNITSGLHIVSIETVSGTLTTSRQVEFDWWVSTTRGYEHWQHVRVTDQFVGTVRVSWADKDGTITLECDIANCLVILGVTFVDELLETRRSAGLAAGPGTGGRGGGGPRSGSGGGGPTSGGGGGGSPSTPSDQELRHNAGREAAWRAYERKFGSSPLDGDPITPP